MIPIFCPNVTPKVVVVAKQRFLSLAETQSFFNGSEAIDVFSEPWMGQSRLQTLEWALPCAFSSATASFLQDAAP